MTARSPRGGPVHLLGRPLPLVVAASFWVSLLLTLAVPNSAQAQRIHGAPDFDAIIAETHTRAEASREAAIRALERFDYTIPATTGSPCCPKPNPAANASAASSEWTGVGFAWMGPAIAAMWGNRNVSAMAIADNVFANVSINFQYNGFAPVADDSCASRILFPFCSGLGECGGLLTTYCNATRGDAQACAACVAKAQWATPAYPTVDPLFPTNATCTPADISAFCQTTAPLPRDTSAAHCHACVGALQKRSVKCHILHQPVTVLPLFNCEGCQQADVNTFCASLGKPSTISHDYCWETRARDATNCRFGLPLEQAHAVRGLSLFDPMSPRVQAGTVGRWSNHTTTLLRELFWGVLEAQVIKDPHGTYRSNVWAQFGSENIDTSNQVTMYVAFDALARVPEYANRTLPDGRPLAVHLAAWEEFWYSWLKARATHGLFVEMASTGYWKRTWPNILNLVDLPSSPRVRLRAKMFVDIAMVEAEQCSIAGVRAGQKSRAKDDNIITNMYPSLTPQLYGTNTTAAAAPGGNNTVFPASLGGIVIEAQAGEYVIANVSVLVHALGAAPATAGVYMMQNRIIGQVNASQIVQCSPARCADTLRPVPCWCTTGADSGAGDLFVMRPVSNQVHTVYRTPSYALGGVVFSPNDYFSPNTQQRWVGLIFGNSNHTALSMNHLTGEKWALIDADIGIFHRCGSCNYGGASVVQIFNASIVSALPPNCTPHSAWLCQNHSCKHCGCSISGGPCPPAPKAPSASQAWQSSPHGWTYVSVVDDGGRPAFAAVRSAYGGDVLVAGSIGGALTPSDTWAPIIILTGRGVDYGNNVSNFVAAVEAADLAVRPGPAAGAKDVSLKWRGKEYTFHAQNATGHYHLPEIDGVAVDVAPPFQYSGPHLTAPLSSDVVTTSYPGYTVEYRFVDGADEIIRTDGPSW